MWTRRVFCGDSAEISLVFSRWYLLASRLVNSGIDVSPSIERFGFGRFFSTGAVRSGTCHWTGSSGTQAAESPWNHAAGTQALAISTSRKYLASDPRAHATLWDLAVLARQMSVELVRSDQQRGGDGSRLHSRSSGRLHEFDDHLKRPASS